MHSTQRPNLSSALLKKEGQSIIKTILSWKYLVMTLITLIPSFYFGIHLSNVEIPATWWPFEVFIKGLTSPIELIYRFIQPLIPPDLKRLMPHCSVAQFLVFLTHQPIKPLAAKYHGEVYWFVLAAVPFWQLFWIISCGIVPFAKENLTWNKVQEALSVIEQTQPLQQGTKQFKAQTLKEEPAPLQTFQDKEKLKERLQNAKLSRSNPSPIIVPNPAQTKLTHNDWQHYKTREGDLLLQDMIRQLQNENQNLQTQKTELKSTFSQYFSPGVVDYLEQNKNSFTNLHNRTQQISILFCDLRGFSQFSQNASSEAVVAHLEEYFEIASHYILHRYNGVISKLMGDGLMAYWGFPLETPDHAYIATQAAQGILNEVRMRNQLYPSRTPLKLGIGIATGEVIIGNIGSTDFKDFTLIGTPVNLAARLEETNKTLGTDLLISEETFLGIRDRIPCKNWGPTTIRSWGKQETLYTPQNIE